MRYRTSLILPELPEQPEEDKGNSREKKKKEEKALPRPTVQSGQTVNLRELYNISKGVEGRVIRDRKTTRFQHRKLLNDTVRIIALCIARGRAVSTGFGRISLHQLPISSEFDHLRPLKPSYLPDYQFIVAFENGKANKDYSFIPRTKLTSAIRTVGEKKGIIKRNYENNRVVLDHSTGDRIVRE